VKYQEGRTVDAVKKQAAQKDKPFDDWFTEFGIEY
jgi:hypothetical protein